MENMQKILGYLRKAIQEFDLLEDSDHVAVGVSGGKDSVVLLTGLVMLQRFAGIDYKIAAITLDPQFGGEQTDYAQIEELCHRLKVPYHVVRTNIGEIVFDVRKEPHPCSLCARLRRGALHDAAVAAGCNKIALGHHFDDAVETFVMNLFHEGRLGCFAPKSYLSRKKLTMIRPLVFAPENEVRKAARRKNLPIVKSVCPVDGTTSRQTTKEWLAMREREDKGFKDRLFGALRRSGLDGWAFKDPNKMPKPRND